MTANINNIIVQKIRQIIRCFETGNVTGADYANISIFNDGPNNITQITYGASQTTEFGLLRQLIKMYVDEKGARYANEFRNYISRIGNKPSLHEEKAFIQLLKNAATDSIMQTVQDRFFNIYYFNPARSWFDKQGFTLPLSLLVIYDSYVHSGSILDFLRNSFPEKVPVNGGNEKKWIESYVNSRDHWLETHTSRPILRNTDYRTDSFIYAIREDNWLLDKPFKIVNYPDAQELKNPILRNTIA